MRTRIAAILFITFLFSCAEQNQFPEKVSTKIPLAELNVGNIQKDKSNNELETTIDFSDLQHYISEFESKSEAFDLNRFEEEWTNLKENFPVLKGNNKDVQTWIEISGFLLELTGKARYGEELERISRNSSNKFQQYITPYVLTKKLDHIYVNLFQSIEIEYEHSMKGEVKFRQETDYPKSGSAKLHFGMTERRYVELFILIPSWAEGTKVTVKGVKYFAEPGNYCKIVKKWKEGDVVNIEFPIKLIPQ